MPDATELTDQDRAFLAGSAGEGARLAMSIVSRMAEVVGAPRLLDISAAHIDSSLYQGPATLEFAERLADGGARVRVPATLNVSGVDTAGWQDWDVPQEWADPARRQMEAYERMGCSPTWTCAPYQTEVRPAFGEQVAWGESSAIVFANSVLGARTERYPDLLDICCAITGRAPATGLHLERNRGGQVLVDLSDITAALGRDPAFFPVLGHWVGGRVGDRIPVLDGLDVVPSEDDLKALGAAMASSGAVALFHWVGVTPEAPDLATAFRGEPPGSTLRATPSELRAARADLGSGLETGDGLELVVLGSPHFSLSEFAALAALVRGRSKYPGVRVLVTTGRAVRDLAGLAGHLSVIEEFGAQLTVDTCILTSPMLPPDVRRLMTNSAKYAYYTPGLLERSVAFGSLVDCVESAVAGRVVRDEASWNL
jgi:predicted aconitase